MIVMFVYLAVVMVYFDIRIAKLEKRIKELEAGTWL